MPEIKEWEDGIIQVKISMAPPLRWVNSYILRGEEGITIIDPGPRTETSIAEWSEAWKQLGFKPDEVHAVVVTHHHPDHVGLAGYIQSITGAQVWMSRRAHAETKLMWGSGSHVNQDLPRIYQKNGMPLEWTLQLPAHLEGFVSQVLPEPRVSYLDEGKPFMMGGVSWIPIETGGHAPGHLSFYDKETCTILCGDAVLPQISPNVSYLPGSDPQPLQSFTDGMLKLAGYPVVKAYPGHRHPFDYFRERLESLLLHHEERLSFIERLLQERPHNGFEVCTALFGTKLGIHQMRFAMSEALAHLIELVRQGRAWKEQSQEGIMYYPVHERQI
ncbi:glyoxylase-like metal-dependent hydrolase (beta-lactamase superfamily II) [Paenibacillus shirakamiensis]|uniref:Glyoxylase-like metal-dependent hydrolase (Beta-lactamase superfamily II) n=1 Tax=Paenibacillus shirakamiensis TaxID=1265935 RepID=A0ABS4JM40_9BACL|nr:MBL fold metallo-hydrolase [Paenibacillus shirakamiensis]MBP2002171.1 glyoxylase-like metal-dependent hydrolase (beta-lactamase superfamily II) [Paenibacillus shirakamiensis]